MAYTKILTIGFLLGVLITSAFAYYFVGSKLDGAFVLGGITEKSGEFPWIYEQLNRKSNFNVPAEFKLCYRATELGEILERNSNNLYHDTASRYVYKAIALSKKYREEEGIESEEDCGVHIKKKYNLDE